MVGNNSRDSFLSTTSTPAPSTIPATQGFLNTNGVLANPSNHTRQAPCDHSSSQVTMLPSSIASESALLTPPRITAATLQRLHRTPSTFQYIKRTDLLQPVPSRWLIDCSIDVATIIADGLNATAVRAELILVHNWQTPFDSSSASLHPAPWYCSISTSAFESAI
jgi:hypothetical protein